jgi:hypothetical protein
MSETVGFEHEESLGPDDPGSMANKLARMAEAKPIEAPPAKTEEELAAETAREAESQEAERVETEAAAAAEAERVAAEAAVLPEPPEPKFSTVEEYQKALKEAETRMHTATTEAAEDRKAKEALTAEIELTKKELAEVKTAQEVAAAEAAKLVPKAERKAAYAEALKKIKAISLTRDPETGEVVYPDDYDDQVAEAWASTSVDPKEVAKEAAQLAREELKRERAGEEADRKAADAKTAAEKEVEGNAKVRADAEKMATEQGLDMTPGSADYRLFYSHVDELANDPKHEYRDKSFEEQVKWATGGVRQVLGKKIEMTDAERAAAKRNQDRNAVLGRGITRVAPPEPPKQRSMQEILQSQHR